MKVLESSQNFIQAKNKSQFVRQTITIEQKLNFLNVAKKIKKISKAAKKLNIKYQTAYSIWQNQQLNSKEINKQKQKCQGKLNQYSDSITSIIDLNLNKNQYYKQQLQYQNQSKQMDQGQQDIQQQHYIFCNIEYKQQIMSEQEKLRIREMIEKTKVNIIQRKKQLRKQNLLMKSNQEQKNLIIQKEKNDNLLLHLQQSMKSQLREMNLEVDSLINLVKLNSDSESFSSSHSNDQFQQQSRNLITVILSQQQKIHPMMKTYIQQSKIYNFEIKIFEKLFSKVNEENLNDSNFLNMLKYQIVCCLDTLSKLV